MLKRPPLYLLWMTYLPFGKIEYLYYLRKDCRSSCDTGVLVIVRQFIVQDSLFDLQSHPRSTHCDFMGRAALLSVRKSGFCLLNFPGGY